MEGTLCTAKTKRIVFNCFFIIYLKKSVNTSSALRESTSSALRESKEGILFLYTKMYKNFTDTSSALCESKVVKSDCSL